MSAIDSSLIINSLTVARFTTTALSAIKSSLEISNSSFSYGNNPDIKGTGIMLLSSNASI